MVHLVQTSLKSPRFCVADFVTLSQSPENRRKVSPILVTLTSRSDSNFERSNISLKETKPDGVDWNSNGLDYCIRNNEGKFDGFR